ncbi:family 20 glycosylhydrolase [Mucilaginibacter rigui]|uniref:beta-N-acetylhexosaminidase n=1 Tax=Mucilaginibacter rigui TaxID=534635 RepID=A0ABR7XCR6_9SPHI|nr:family 20 glycosylhydrolase [Mucilaginibacter rigui]
MVTCKLLLSVLFLCYCTNTNAQEYYKNLNIIPYPSTLTPGEGYFVINAQTTLIAPSRFVNGAAQLNKLVKAGTGHTLIQGKSNPTNTVKFVYDGSIKNPEAYRLNITTKHIIITAGTPAGAFHAVETIRQLLPVSVETGQKNTQVSLPSVNIDDQPAYAWRGMHLDVSRHFFSISYLKKFIDVMALYKMNKFHLHLTDDQGWRVEIKKYPKLTEQGAWRTFNNQDSACMKRAADNPDFNMDQKHIIHKNGKTLYGGFYTQQQLKDLVAYAANRHIDIIPEIDMPGHMMAAINAYPFLTCDSQNKWGELFSTPICPCSETTFEFAKNVYTEIMDIFPSKYIHIGGDEVDRRDWGKSEACKELMKREGITSLPDLQNYFIDRMEQFFNSKGRKLIGWDEVLEGKISSTAMIMYWRSWVPDAPVKAAQHGNQVIMTPGTPLYFDNPADKNSISNVYHFNPVPQNLTAEQAKLIIGAQANIWTEYIPSEKRADYMYMPRMTALAELLWTNKQDYYKSYTQRLVQQYSRLEALNINYRQPDLEGVLDTRVFITSDTVKVNSPLSTSAIRYTTNGDLPGQNSPLLRNYVVNHPQTIKLAAFTPSGKRGDIYTVKYVQQTLAQPVTATGVATGLAANYYKGFFKGASGITQGAADSTFVTQTISVPASVKAPSFAIKYRGYIDVPKDGVYTFYLTCDDSGILNVANRETVNNDGMHSPMEKSGQVALKKGLQPFALDFVEGGGGYTLKLQYSINGNEREDVPESWFKHNQ